MICDRLLEQFHLLHPSVFVMVFIFQKIITSLFQLFFRRGRRLASMVVSNYEYPEYATVKWFMICSSRFIADADGMPGAFHMPQRPPRRAAAAALPRKRRGMAPKHQR